MGRFASGKYSYGISDRSGFRYRLRDMRREWNGLLVGPDEYEPKHPQLTPPRNVVDAEALRNPRPDTQNIVSVEIKFPAFNLQTVQFIPTPFAKVKLGNISISGAVPVQPIDVAVTGVSATISLGSLSVSAFIASTFDSTDVTLDSSNKTFDEG
jgi:hypothetical protein